MLDYDLFEVGLLSWNSARKTEETNNSLSQISLRAEFSTRYFPQNILNHEIRYWSRGSSLYKVANK